MNLPSDNETPPIDRGVTAPRSRAWPLRRWRPCFRL